MRGALTACGIVSVLIEVVVPIEEQLDDDDDLDLSSPGNVSTLTGQGRSKQGYETTHNTKFYQNTPNILKISTSYKMLPTYVEITKTLDHMP